MRFLPTLALAAALVAPGVSAGAEPQIDLCRDYADLAGIVMHNRQIGVPYQAMIDDTLTANTPYVAELSVTLVNRAYQEPRYQDWRVQEQVVHLFQANTYARCEQFGLGE